MDNVTENCIEWITGDERVTLTLSQKRFITKVRKLADKNPDEIKIEHTNKDGSIVCSMPLRAIKISLAEKRELTDEQRKEISDRLQKYRDSGQEVDDEDLNDEE